jgi:hypothetical protein
VFKEVDRNANRLFTTETGLDHNGMFSIGFTDQPVEYPYDDTSIPAAPGKLLLGKSTEDFVANLSLWSKSDYESHWVHELKALAERASKIALVVSYDDPNASSNMEIWRVYRDGEWGPLSKSTSVVPRSSRRLQRLEDEPVYSGSSSNNRRGKSDFRMARCYSGHRIVPASF